MAHGPTPTDPIPGGNIPTAKSAHGSLKDERRALVGRPMWLIAND